VGWGYSPVEFWRTHPTEFWWIAAAKFQQANPPKPYAGSLTRRDVERLSKRLERKRGRQSHTEIHDNG